MTVLMLVYDSLFSSTKRNKTKNKLNSYEIPPYCLLNLTMLKGIKRKLHR